MKLRINKLISEALFCSRRDADEYIKAARVKINGKIAQLSDSVDENDEILFDQVDLPTKDLIRQSVADSKQNKFENAEKRHKKSRKDERVDSQRIQAAPKSAALRKTSKNNPENKNKVKKMRKHSWEDDDNDEIFIRKSKSKARSYENKGKSSFRNSRNSSDYMDFDDDF